MNAGSKRRKENETGLGRLGDREDAAGEHRRILILLYTEHRVTLYDGNARLPMQPDYPIRRAHPAALGLCSQRGN